MPAPNYYSPLRYPGGKGKLAEFIKQVLRINRLLDCAYVEPYAGGAGLAMELLLQGYVSEIHINDVDPAVWAFWHCVLKRTDELCERIERTKVDLATWRKQRKVLAASDLRRPGELGFAAFFLNRTNRSGILTAGVIGGQLQDGKWKLDARFNRSDLIDRVQSIAAWERSIHLHRLDALRFIRTKASLAKKPTLIYLDPPYYVKGGDLYEHHYKHDDHVAVARAIKRFTRVKWLVSYDNVPAVNELYDSFRAVEYSLNYTAADRYRGTEVMFFGPGLAIPGLCAPMRAA